MTDLSPGEVSPILAHYSTGYEKARLGTGPAQLERVRTREILSQFLPMAPANVVDIGGGPGAHAVWLASRGYNVDLLDLVPLHVEQAREEFDKIGPGTARAQVGDARQLPYAGDSMDAALVLGPLYHLPEKDDRLKALREAWRVLRPGGYVAVAGISRFASLMDGFFRGFINDPRFVGIVEADLRTGRHENPAGEPTYFTTAYFHHPTELVEELGNVGFRDVEIVAVEGPFWCLQTFDEVWADNGLRDKLLSFLSKIDRDSSLIGASAHLLALGRKSS
jgi:ubiquinone/menaquinone biosynthesis C-methylase UbiE